MKIFISAVSSEFKACRNEIASDLRAAGATVHVQEDFANKPGTLLQLLENYIAECDRVILLIGNAYGAEPVSAEIPPGAPRRSYTQWEYVLAAGERLDGSHAASKDLYLYFASSKFDPDTPTQQDQEFAKLQIAHRDHIIASGHVRSEFSSIDNLGRLVLRDGFQLKSVLYKPNNLPYPSLGSLFKGRDEFLTKIRETLGSTDPSSAHRAAAITASANIAAVHGLGGIGKTRAAVEYGHSNAEEFTAMLYVRADSPENLQANLAGLCGAAVLDLPVRQSLAADAQVQAVIHWLAGKTGWFLILDNVDTEDAARAVEDLLVRLGNHGQILITSRISRWKGAIRSLALDIITVEASVDYLLAATAGERQTAQSDVEDAIDISLALGQLPLALTQAAAYICELGLTFRSYLRRWNEAHDKIMGWFDERQMQYPKSVAVTWETSFAQLSEDARKLLRILSFFAPDPIPTSILQLPIPEVDGLPEIPAETLEGTEAQLKRYSLVMRDVDAATFSVHLLVQDVTRSGMPPDKIPEALGRALNWLNAAFTGNPQDVRTWPTLVPLLPHAEFAALTYTAQSQSAAAAARLLNCCALLHTDRALYAVAEPLYRRALAIREATLGPDHPDVAVSLNDLAGQLEATNRLHEAEEKYRRALAIRIAAHGPDSTEVAQSLNDLAGLLKATNRLVEAETMCRRALKIREERCGPDDPSVAQSMNDLAELLRETNRRAEAEPLYRRAVAIYEASYGRDHPTVALAINNLAELLHAINRLAEAESMYRRALSIYEASYGPDHPAVASALNTLALLLQDTNRLFEAESMYTRALAIDEASYGPDHPNVATSLNNLGLLLQSTNRLAEAEPIYRRSLAIRERSFGRDHPEVAASLNNLANLLYTSSHFGEAGQLYRRALSISEASYGPDHPEVATRLNNLALLLQATNRLEEAEPLMRRSLEIRRQSYGESHPMVANGLGNLAVLMYQLNKQEESEATGLQALSTWNACESHEDPRRGKAHLVLGLIESQRGNGTAAAAQLNDAIRFLSQKSGMYTAEIVQARSELEKLKQ